MITTARIGPGQSKEPRTPPGTPVRAAGAQALGLPLLLSEVHEPGAGLKVELPELKLVHTLDASVTGCGLIP